MRRLDGLRTKRAGFVGAAGDPIQSIFGSNLAVYWSAQDSLLTAGTEVRFLPSRIAPTTITLAPAISTARPQYIASDPVFAGKPSVKCIPTQLLSNVAMPAGLLPAGCHPTIWMVGCVDAFPSGGGDYVLMGLRQSVDWDCALRQVDEVGSRFSLRFVNNHGNSDSLGPNSTTMLTTPFVIASLLWDYDDSELWMNKVSYDPVGSGGSATPGDVVAVALNSNALKLQSGYTRIALAGICTETPTPQQLAALWDYAHANYGVP